MFCVCVCVFVQRDGWYDEGQNGLWEGNKMVVGSPDEKSRKWLTGCVVTRAEMVRGPHSDVRTLCTVIEVLAA